MSNRAPKVIKCVRHRDVNPGDEIAIELPECTMRIYGRATRFMFGKLEFVSLSGVRSLLDKRWRIWKAEL